MKKNLLTKILSTYALAAFLLPSIVCSDPRCPKAALRTVAIMAPYSSSRFYREAFQKHGVRVISIHPKATIEDPYFAATYDSTGYDGEYYLSSSLQALKQQMIAKGDIPERIFTGSDPGIIPAYQLGKEFELSNINDLSWAGNEWDKADCYERLKGYVAVPQQIATQDLNEAFKLAKALWTEHPNFPVVLKPRGNSGSKHVFFCHSFEEIKAKFQLILESESMHSVIVSEYIDGDEFALDFESADGVHKVTDNLLYDREIVPGYATRYKADHLISFRGNSTLNKSLTPAFMNALYRFGRKVLNRKGILWGSSHLEVKYSPTRKRFYFIEMSPRPIGADITKLVEEATGQSQITKGVQSFLNLESFKQSPDGYVLQKHASLVFISSEGKGTMSQKLRPWIDSLPEVIHSSWYIPHGKPTYLTVDADTVSAAFSIVHRDFSSVQKLAKDFHQLNIDNQFEDVVH